MLTDVGTSYEKDALSTHDTQDPYGENHNRMLIWAPPAFISARVGTTGNEDTPAVGRHTIESAGRHTTCGILASLPALWSFIRRKLLTEERASSLYYNSGFVLGTL